MGPYNPFPASYTPMYPNAWQPYMQAGQQAPQAMTPPTIHADIIQVENEAEADKYPMSSGSPPQMFIKRDESEIYVKTMLANNGHELAVYVKRPPKVTAQDVDMGMYVTKDELEKRLEALMHKTEVTE